MDGTVLEQLLADVKNALDVTWDDAATDRKYSAWIVEGAHYLNAKAGEQLDFETQPDAMALLKDYVRYARDGAMDVFENNYRHLILALQHDRMLARRSAAVEDGQNETSAFPPGQ